MNIFELYLDKIKSVIVDLNKNNKLEIPENFNGINAEIPPPKFDCDISTNVAMVLSKINKTSPLQLAEKLAPIIKNNDSEIETISVAKPWFGYRYCFNFAVIIFNYGSKFFCKL